MNGILDVAHRLNENVWFEAFQSLLLRIANTREGRDLLCIDQEFPTIHRFYKNAIHSYLGGNKWKAQFRIGAKWANVIRHRWPEFKKLAKKHYETEQNALPATMLWTPQFMFAAHATDTFYPAAGSNDPADGHIVGPTSTTTSTARQASSGTAAPTSTSLITRYARVDNNRTITRAIANFDTSTLGAGATVSDGTVSLYATAKSDGDNDEYAYLRLVLATPASTNDVIGDDFDQVGALNNPTAQATDVDISNITTSAYNDWSLNATGISNIELTGVTSFGWREGHDLANQEILNNKTNSITASSADETGTSQDPRLVVTYTTSVDNALFFANNF